MIDARQHVIGKLVPYDFETITVADTAIGLTAAKLASDPKPKEVWITVETAQFRYRVDGTDPTAGVGHVVNPFDSLKFEGFSQLNNAKFIRKGATSASISVTYLR
jgi:hypothetical protein